ncbi:MAG: hypothetical protein AB7F79_12530, partial [Steroidobacteraceae bacterium]
GIIRSHFGTDIKLPDASWAVFWLTGALTLKRWWPALLMLACVTVDYFVIAGGVSAYCFTPAYPFLLPAYLSLWAMGRWSSTQLQLDARSVLNLSLSILLGTTACFAISNIGFYAASGHFAQMTITEYTQAVLRYWPRYLQTTAMYVTGGLTIYLIAHRVPSRKTMATRTHQAITHLYRQP